jgi:hypothetical protein
VLNPDRFAVSSDESGSPLRMRVRRGTRFRVGDALGTLNRMAHVHLQVGPHGAEINPLSLGLPGFVDTVPPLIVPRGIDLYDETGARLSERRKGRLIVSGRVSVVVEAFDRVDGNGRSRRLGVYAAGYQVLDAKVRTAGPVEINQAQEVNRAQDGSAENAFGSGAPRMTVCFNRFPGAPEAPWLTYAAGSGITVYGNRTTRFRYIVTHSVCGGEASGGYWDTRELPPGDYVLRALVADFAGNAAHRDLPIAIEHR